MPPAPELPEGFGQIGRIKILAHGDTQHPGQAQDHVDTAGEIAVELQGIQEHSRQGVSALVLDGVSADGADNDPQPGRDHILFQQTPHRPGSAIENTVPGDPAVIQRPVHGVITLDGADEQMGNVGYKQGVTEQIPLRLILSPVHIHIIGNDLQGKVGDTHGGQQRDACHRLEFEHQQHGSVQDDPYPGQPGDFLGQQGRAIRQQRRCRQIGQTRPAIACVDQQADQKNQNIYDHIINYSATGQAVLSQSLPDSVS